MFQCPFCGLELITKKDVVVSCSCNESLNNERESKEILKHWKLERDVKVNGQRRNRRSLYRK